MVGGRRAATARGRLNGNGNGNGSGGCDGAGARGVLIAAREHGVERGADGIGCVPTLPCAVGLGGGAHAAAPR